MGWTGLCESPVSYYSLPDSPLPISVLANKQSSVVGLLEWARRKVRGVLLVWGLFIGFGESASVSLNIHSARV